MLQFIILISLIIVLACKISKPITYYVKFTLFIIFTMVASLIFLPFMIHRPRDSRNGMLPCWMCRMTSRWLGVTFEIQGQENIVPEGQGCVVVINHQSALDIIVMAYIWPYIPRGYLIVKRSVMWLIPFGPAAWMWGTVYINRMNGPEAHTIVNSIADYIATKKNRLCLFPEGTRHMGDKLLPFKKGAFHSALTAQCPIQPVVVSKMHFLDNKKKHFGSGHNIIKFLPAIPTAGLHMEQMPELMEQVRNIMQDEFNIVSVKTKIKS